MRTNHYRTISHWFNWEELDFPNPGVEERIRKKVAAAAAAKVELAVVFGFHFRWDYVYNFDLVHKLIEFTVNEYHKYGIKVIDHHSAVLTYRPRSWQDRRDNFNMNHHHVPMTPDPAFIDQLAYAGKSLNSFRQKRTDDNTPLFLPSYHCDVFCVNNPDFRFAYRAYVQRMFAETNVDGLMCDDVGHYGRWGSCVCEHCRKKFRDMTGKALPPASDFNFWGNYDNPDFRAWIYQHMRDGRDFLQMVRDSIPAGKLLTTCCSCSTWKLNDATGLDLSIWQEPLNMVMLEMCGNISGDKNSIETRIPDMLLNCGIAERRNTPCLGLGYAFFPDEGFRTWSLNKFFNSDSWISTHKARCGLTFEQQCALPDEPEIVHEAYNFDAAYPELSELDDIAEVAVLLSGNSRNYNGGFVEDYACGFAGVLRELYRANVTATVTAWIPENADKIKYLVLSDADCLSNAERTALDKYCAAGGKLIINGLCGGRDDSGKKADADSYLVKFGLEPIAPVLDRTMSSEVRDTYFRYTFWELNGPVPAQVEYKAAQPLAGANEFGFYKLSENVLWSPNRCHDPENARQTAAMLKNMISEPLKLDVPDSVRYRIYKSKDNSFVVHFMPVNITGILHDSIKLHGSNPIVKGLVYEDLTGIVKISGDISSCTLYAADLDAARTCQVSNGVASVDLTGLKRFFSVKVK